MKNTKPTRLGVIFMIVNIEYLFELFCQRKIPLNVCI